MNAQELRIGNILLFDKTEPVVITEIYKKKVKFYNVTDNVRKVEGTVDLSSLQPLNITDELLLKCGFEKATGKHGEYYFHKVYKALRLWFNDLIGSYTVGRKDLLTNTGTYWIKGGMKYLHQLQNLHFALIGKELEIKLSIKDNKVDTTYVYRKPRQK